jgi:hypothetical protein
LFESALLIVSELLLFPHVLTTSFASSSAVAALELEEGLLWIILALS